MSREGTAARLRAQPVTFVAGLVLWLGGAAAQAPCTLGVHFEDRLVSASPPGVHSATTPQVVTTIDGAAHIFWLDERPISPGGPKRWQVVYRRATGLNVNPVNLQLGA